MLPLASHLLLVHRNFPGQFRYLVAEWLRLGISVDAIGATEPEELPPDLVPQALPTALRYWPLPQPPAIAQEPADADLDAAFRRGRAVAELAQRLRDEKGLQPDAVICHSAWGEALHLRGIWPGAVLLTYPELYGSPRCLGYGFDPHLPPIPTALWQCIDRQNLLAGDAVLSADGAVVPTAFQRDSFPPLLRQQLHLIHEGVDTSQACPDPQACFACDNGLALRPGDPVVTLSCRSLEPLRGVRPFIEALPALQHAHADLQVVVAGQTTEAGYGPQSLHPEGFFGELLEQLGHRLDLSRLHVVGWLPLERLLSLYQVTAAHVYLSYPYTLSWSVLQAMACGAPVVGNGDGPLAEVIEPGRNGLLVDFHDSAALAAALHRLLANPDWRRTLGAAARETIETRFGLQQAAAAYLELMDRLAAVR